MGIYDQSNRKRFADSLQENSLLLLIIINLVFFILFAFVQVFFIFTFGKDIGAIRFQADIYHNLAIPADPAVFIKKPWTLFTHMFYHKQVWHIIGNLLWLWIFGYIFYDLTGNRKIIPLFIYGAVGGVVAFMLAYNLIPALAEINATATGASAGIMAIVVATTVIAPDYRLFQMLHGGIPIWIITVIYMAIDLSLLADSNTGGRFAHLAGGLTGFLFIYFMRRGYDWSNWMNNFFDWVGNLFNPDRPSKKTKEFLFYKAGRKPFSKTPNLTQQRVDEILDKISTEGYESLSEEEKKILERASKEEL